MSYSIETIPRFDRQFKQLFKKYPSLSSDITNLKIILQDLPETGTPIGYKCYKIRVSITSKGRGKSGGARVITTVAIRNEIVYLLSIYDKSDKQTITDNEIEDLLRQVPE